MGSDRLLPGSFFGLGLGFDLGMGSSCQIASRVSRLTGVKFYQDRPFWRTGAPNAWSQEKRPALSSGEAGAAPAWGGRFHIRFAAPWKMEAYSNLDCSRPRHVQFDDPSLCSLESTGHDSDCSCQVELQPIDISSPYVFP